MSAAGATTGWDARVAPVSGPMADVLWRTSAVLASLVVVQALFSLATTATGVSAPSAYVPASEPMLGGSSLTFLLLASSMLLAVGRGQRRVRRPLSLLAASAAVVLAAFMFAREVAASVAPGPRVPLDWIAPNTAVASILLGLAAISLSVSGRRTQLLREPLAIAAGFIGFLGLLGYLYEITELYWLAGSNAMSLPSCLAVLALSTAVILARSDGGLGALLAVEGMGGQLARRMLPAAVLIPTVLGLVRVGGEHMQYYDSELGTALLIATTVMLFGGATVWSAAALGRVDTARRLSTRALHEESHARELERRRLRAVLDVLPVGVVIADARGQLLEVSAGARRIFGEPSEPEPLSRYARLEGFDARTGARLKPEDWAMRRALQRGETCLGQEIDVETLDGAKKTILASAAPIRDPSGRIAGAVSISVDITARKRNERELASLKEQLEERVRERTAELEAANAELEAFSYSVSHDLRAPLRWIDGFASALSEEHAAELGGSGREYLAELRDSVRRMRELIDALLGLARVTAQPLDRQPIDLGAIAHEVARVIESENGSRRVEWRIAHGVTVHADPRLLRIVLDNLVRNAWKFTRERDPGRIEIGADNVEGELAIYVRDDGVGFDPDYADKLFRPFERLHPADAYEGTGIGLALVQRIVQRHGGRVWARSEPGRGATFWFTLTPPGGGGGT